MMDGELPRLPNIPSYMRTHTAPSDKPISQETLFNTEYNIFQERDVPQDNRMLGIPLAEQYSERITTQTSSNPILRTARLSTPPSLLQLSSYSNWMWYPENDNVSTRPRWANYLPAPYTRYGQTLGGRPTNTRPYPDAFTFAEMSERDAAGFTAYNLHVRVDQDLIDNNEMLVGNFNSMNQAVVLLDSASYENNSNKFIFADEVP
jgi:hypothetical protein